MLYLGFGTLSALWGATDAIMMRTELATAPVDVWTAGTYNSLFTTHGLTMLFFFVTPVFFGIANYVLPLLIGAADLAFPRVNALGFWLLPPSFTMVRAGLITELVGKGLQLIPGGRFDAVVEVLLVLEPPSTGWTMYTARHTGGEPPNRHHAARLDPERARDHHGGD